MNVRIDWQTGPGSLAVLALVVTAAVLAWRHAAVSTRVVSRRRARVLLALRGLTLLLLALTALRPTLWSTDTRPRPLHVVLDDSASMAAADAERSPADWGRVAAALGEVDEDAVSGRSRFELAVAALRTLARSPAAAGGMTVTTLDGRGVNLSSPPGPAGAGTPLTEALHDATAAAVAAGDDTVVLLSDGRSTEFRPRPAAAGAAVFAVAVAPEDRRPALRVTRIDARPIVLAGQSLPVRVRLAQRNAVGMTVRVVLTDGTHDVSRDTVLGEPETTVEMAWPLPVAPRLRLVARAGLVATTPGWTMTWAVGPSGATPSAAGTDVTVVPTRERVLMIAGPEGRDAAGLTDALAGAPWIELNRPAATTRPATRPADDFAKADLIVLSDVPAAALDDAAWDALATAVRDGGRSLLVLAGRGAWLGEPEIARHLAGLLPVGAGPRPRWVTPPADRGVWPVPSRAGGESTFLRLDETPDASFRAWLGRPRMSRVLDAGPPKPLARPLLLDRTTQAPVLLDAAAGRGRVAMVLVDEIWRWPIPADAEPPQRRFWQGLVRSLYDLPYDQSAGGMSLSLDRAQSVSGEPITVRARTLTPDDGPLSITAVRDGVVIDTPILREPLAASGRVTATLNLPPGDYRIVLRQAGRSLRTPLRVTADALAEEGDLTADPALLRGVAEATGGAAVPLERFGELSDAIVSYRTAHPHVRSVTLWSSFYWFAAIVAALGLEWALRAETGLA